MMLRKTVLTLVLLLTGAAFVPVGCQREKTPDPYARLSALKEKLRQDPEDVASLVELGRVYVQLEQLKSALRQYETAVSLDSTYFDAHHELGVTLRKLRRYEEAAGALRKAIELNPTSAEAHNSLGLVYYKSGSTDQAMMTFRQSIELDPDCAEAHYNLGAIYRERKEYEKASHHWEKYRALQQKSR